MSMKQYMVGPVMNSKRWKVEEGGFKISEHNSKSNAIQKAKGLADRNDEITVQDSDGLFQKQL